MVSLGLYPPGATFTWTFTARSTSASVNFNFQTVANSVYAFTSPTLTSSYQTFTWTATIPSNGDKTCYFGVNGTASGQNIIWNAFTATRLDTIATGNVGVGTTTPQVSLDVNATGALLGAGGASVSSTYGDVRVISGNVGNGFTFPYIQTYQAGNSGTVGVPGYVLLIQPFNYYSSVAIGHGGFRGVTGGLDTPQQYWFPNSQVSLVAKANWLAHRPTNTVTGAQAPTVAITTDYLNYNNPINTTPSSTTIYSNFGSIALTPATSGITIIARVMFRAASSGQNSYERICDFGNGAATDNICLGRSSTTNQLFTSIFKGSASAGNLTGGTIVQNVVTNVAMKYSPSAGYIYLYQDGALLGSLASAAATYAIDNTRTNCYIGRSAWGDPMFTGYIYQFQCHNAVLTDKEIFTVMNSWAGTSVMAITTEGRVGIGTSTPSSNDLFEVKGNVTIANDATVQTFINMRQGLAGGYNCSISTYSHNGDAYNDGLSLNGWDGVSICTGSNTRQERVRIDSNGNVGIGTTSPNAALNVSGNGPYSGLTTNPQPGQLIINTTTGSERLILGAWYTGGIGSICSIQASDYYSSVDHGQGLALNPLGGNVGIGATSLIGTLTVQVSGNTNGMSVGAWGSEHFLVTQSSGTTSNAVAIGYQNGVGGWLYSLAPNVSWRPMNYGATSHSFYNASASPIIVMSGTTLSCTGDIIAYSSDDRLKKRLRSIDSPLDKLKSLSGFIYIHNEVAKSYGFDDEDEKVGVSAQEVQKVVPQAVKPAPFDLDDEKKSKSGQNYLTVQYERLVPLLIEALKEESRKREALEERIKILEQR